MISRGRAQGKKKRSINVTEFSHKIHVMNSFLLFHPADAIEQALVHGICGQMRATPVAGQDPFKTEIEQALH